MDKIETWKEESREKLQVAEQELDHVTKDARDFKGDFNAIEKKFAKDATSGMIRQIMMLLGFTRLSLQSLAITSGS